MAVQKICKKLISQGNESVLIRAQQCYSAHGTVPRATTILIPTEREVTPMRSSVTLIALILLMTCTAGCQSKVDRQQATPEPQVTNPTSQVAKLGTEAKGCVNPSVVSATTLLDPGGNVDWSPDGRLIAYDLPDAQNWTGTWVMNVDGTHQRCLTCNNPAAPTKFHLGNPTWHPSMEWIVIQGISNSFFNQFPSKDEAYKQRVMDVGVGIGNDLWAMASDGKRFVQLTDVRSETGFNGGILHPHFSHNGKLLAWAQRIGAVKNDSEGEWAIKIADFSVTSGTPLISNIRTFQPGKATQHLYETHEFTHDDTQLLFASNSDGQAKTGYDIYRLEIASGQATQLTNTPKEWDEHAQFSPDDKCIVWASSMNAGSKASLLKLELWTMAADGSNQQQLTFFNAANATIYPKDPFGSIPADSSWSPDGKQIAVHVIVNQGKQTAFSMPGKIVLLTLK